MYAPGRFTFNVNVQSIFDLYINTADKVKEDYTVLNAKAVRRYFQAYSTAKCSCKHGTWLIARGNESDHAGKQAAF